MKQNKTQDAICQSLGCTGLDDTLFPSSLNSINIAGLGSPKEKRVMGNNRNEKEQ
jgi:hypothetical protein